MFKIPSDILSKIQEIAQPQPQLITAEGPTKIGVYQIVCGTCQDTCRGTCRNRCNQVGKGTRR